LYPSQGAGVLGIVKWDRGRAVVAGGKLGGAGDVGKGWKGLRMSEKR
jgi:hypothetical protein